MIKYAVYAASRLWKRHERGYKSIKYFGNHCLTDIGFDHHEVAVVSEFIDRSLSGQDDLYDVFSETPLCLRVATDRVPRRKPVSDLSPAAANPMRRQRLVQTEDGRPITFLEFFASREHAIDPVHNGAATSGRRNLSSLVA